MNPSVRDRIITKELVSYSGQTFSNAKEAYTWLNDAMERIYNQAVEESELRGIGKILDCLWDNSMNLMGEKGADRIKDEMEYYFSENWATDMYDFIEDFNVGMAFLPSNEYREIWP